MERPKVGQNEPKRASGMSILDSRRRFRIPGEVVHVMSWTGYGAPARLVVELVGLGRLRLWGLAQLQAGLSIAEKDLGEPSLEGQGEILRAFWDRYREVTLRPSDARVQLTRELHAILFPELGIKPLYVEAGEGFVEVFAPRARIARLKKHLDETNVALFLGPQE